MNAKIYVSKFLIMKNRDFLWVEVEFLKINLNL